MPSTNQYLAIITVVTLLCSCGRDEKHDTPIAASKQATTNTSPKQDEAQKDGSTGSNSTTDESKAKVAAENMHSGEDGTTAQNEAFLAEGRQVRAEIEKLQPHMTAAEIEQSIHDVLDDAPTQTTDTYQGKYIEMFGWLWTLNDPTNQYGKYLSAIDVRFEDGVVKSVRYLYSDNSYHELIGFGTKEIQVNDYP